MTLKENKVSILLTVVGVKIYILLKNLCTSDRPSSKSKEEVIKIVQEHLYPKLSFIMEQYKLILCN